MALSQQRFVRLETGGAVQITEGILKGSGPQGDVGPRGATGPAAQILGNVATVNDLQAITNPRNGDCWIVEETGHVWCWVDPEPGDPYWADGGRIVGPPGYLQSVSAQVSVETREQNVPGSGSPVQIEWTTVDWNDSEQIQGFGNVDIVTPGPGQPFTTLRVNHTEARTYLFSIQLDVSVIVARRGRSFFRLMRNNIEVARYYEGVDGYATADQTVSLTWAGNTSNADSWSWEATSNVAVDINGARWQVARLGGGIGPEGPQGREGPPPFYGQSVNTISELPLTGAPGELRYVQADGTVHSWNVELGTWMNAGVFQGPPGEEGSGYTTFDGVANLDPNFSEQGVNVGGTPNSTADQGFTYPSGPQTPAVPYFLKTLAEEVEKYVVARYPSESELGVRRPTSSNGEVVFIDGGADAGQLRVIDSRHVGGYAVIPVVMWGDTSPPSAANLPDGTIYIEY